MIVIIGEMSGIALVLFFTALPGCALSAVIALSSFIIRGRLFSADR